MCGASRSKDCTFHSGVETSGSGAAGKALAAESVRRLLNAEA